MSKQALLFAVLLGYGGGTLAHGNVHERIHRLDHDIAHHPKDVALLIKRGQLLLDEGHAAEARDDFAKASKLAPERIESLYHLGRAQLMLKQPDAALATARGFLAQATHDAAKARGLMLTGDSLSAAGQALAAAEAYLAAIHLSREPRPDQLLQAAEAFHVGGRADKALAVLNEGIGQLGPLHTLNERALALELEQQAYEPALRRIDQLLETRQRVPFLLYKKGVVLKALARVDQSRQTFASALREIDGLPLSRQQSPALKNLRSSLVAQLD